MRHICLSFGLLLLWSPCVLAAESRPAVLVVVGAEGSKEYAQPFRDWAARWQKAAEQAHADFMPIGLAEKNEQADRELLQEAIGTLHSTSTEPLWLVLIGHGTYDGKTAKFNLRGPDVTPAEQAAWLKLIERRLASIDCSSS
jgi:hypothetical protein